MYSPITISPGWPINFYKPFLVLLYNHLLMVVKGHFNIPYRNSVNMYVHWTTEIQYTCTYIEQPKYSIHVRTWYNRNTVYMYVHCTTEVQCTCTYIVQCTLYSGNEYWHGLKNNWHLLQIDQTLYIFFFSSDFRIKRWIFCRSSQGVLSGTLGFESRFELLLYMTGPTNSISKQNKRDYST